MANKPFPPAPELPGARSRHSLVYKEGTKEAACPICGAVWLNGRPWSGKAMSPAELAPILCTTQQAISARIRTGTIAAYPKAGDGRNGYLIPIFEVERVVALGNNKHVEDLGKAPEVK